MSRIENNCPLRRATEFQPPSFGRFLRLEIYSSCCAQVRGLSFISGVVGLFGVVFGLIVGVGRVAERTSSRLRRTNDRSVSGVISGDAEDASHVSGSYPSKQKYKLDSSSLHEDHEDDENAEIGVPLHAQLRINQRI